MTEAEFKDYKLICTYYDGSLNRAFAPDTIRKCKNCSCNEKE